MTHSVLILGAGLMQRPAIEAAHELGLSAVVADANPRAVCARFADRFEPVDLKDREGLLSLARSLGPNLLGVFTAGTDFSASVSYVAEALNLPAHSFESACNASNKVRMRACFERHRVPSPSFREIDRNNLASLLEPDVLSSLRFPLVVKPVDNMGARGCRLVRDTSELLLAVEDAVCHSVSSKAILEDFMEGPEFSIDAVIYKGTFTVTGFADRHIFYEPYFIEMGHTMPTSLDEAKRLELIACFARAAHALGLTCGVAKADIKYTSHGPMVGEVAARLSGGYMSGWTFPYASGCNLTREALCVAVGREPASLLKKRTPLASPPDLPYELYELCCTRASAERAWISIPGTVSALYGEDDVQGVPGLHDVFVRSRAGAHVSFPRNNVEKCGNVISAAASRAQAVESADRARSCLVVRLKPFEPETDSFLSGAVRGAENGFPPDAFGLDGKTRAAFDAFLDSAPDLAPDRFVAEQLPPCLASVSDSLCDWNGRTIIQTLRMFDFLVPVHGTYPGKVFWNSLVRGGIQGIMYVHDCADKKERLHS